MILKEGIYFSCVGVNIILPDDTGCDAEWYIAARSWWRKGLIVSATNARFRNMRMYKEL